MKHFHTAAFLAIAASVLSVPNANATKINRVDKANATNSCSPSLPFFEGVVRKRPLAVQNEGSELSYVSCSFSNTGTLNSVSITLINLSGTPKNVDCTGVNASATQDTSVYTVKTAFIAPNGFAKLDYNPSDFGAAPGNPFPSLYVSMLCKLVPSTGIA